MNREPEVPKEKRSGGIRFLDSMKVGSWKYTWDVRHIDGILLHGRFHFLYLYHL